MREEGCTCESPMSGASYHPECPLHGRHMGEKFGWKDMTEREAFMELRTVAQTVHYPDNKPWPGQIWQHFKGNRYVILYRANDCEDPNRMLIVYQNEREKDVWVRPLSEWLDEKETIPDESGAVTMAPRFRLVGITP